MQNGKVTRLPPQVAQRIAAGEVIDRPYAVVRELLDNAVDAGADSIDLAIEQGGIETIRVTDNGRGMNKEDLSLCWQSHATSKISTLADLDALQTLGFRGEALNSIAVSAELRIVTADPDTGSCHTLRVAYGRNPVITQEGFAKGTIVEVRNLFHEIPARKKFLKSPQGESSACRKMFIDKALPFPDIQFRYYSGNSLKLFLPKTDLKSRIIGAYGRILEKQFLDEAAIQGGTFSCRAVLSTPSLYRTDKSYIQIYINNRRVQEYSLVQAVIYGYSSFLPGGAYPYCFIFLTVSPDSADFNIHPAKREVKLRNIREIHHALASGIREHVSRQLYGSRNSSPELHTHNAESAEKKPQFRPGPSMQKSEIRHAGESSASRTLWEEELEKARLTSPAVPTLHSAHSHNQREFSTSADSQRASDASDASAVSDLSQEDDFVYHGQIFRLFLLAERHDELLIIDQHAAHERIIYESLKQSPVQQKLLIPISFTADPDVDEFLKKHAHLYAAVGMNLKRTGRLTWELSAIPALCRGIEHELVELICSASGNTEEIEKELYASISCRAAVKDGDLVDNVTARFIIRNAFRLPVPRCPHGRPIWFSIDRNELFRHVQRIIDSPRPEGS